MIKFQAEKAAESTNLDIVRPGVAHWDLRPVERLDASLHRTVCLAGRSSGHRSTSTQMPMVL